MLPKLINANYVQNFVIHLCFSDGTAGDIDLSQELNGKIFAPLKEISYFKSFCFNRELHTITWPNGADFAPEFLYEKLQILV